MTGNNSGSFHQIEHTADIGLNLRGKNLKYLFESGFYGILDILSNKKPPANEHKTIKITSSDNESLLVDFLNEIIYLVNTERWLPAEIKEMKITSNSLKAVITGSQYNSPDAVKAEVKAATYHNLKIRESVDTVETDIYFDI